MSPPSKQHARPTLVKKEALQANEQVPRVGCIPNSAAAEAQVDDGLCCLSGDKPIFDVILLKSHIYSPYCLTVPAHIVPGLPRDIVPVVLTHRGKNWKVSYNGKPKQWHRFDSAGWRSFVADNNLECGDACIFELMESSAEGFRLEVVILRDTWCLPPELQADVPDAGADGKTPETAIEID